MALPAEHDAVVARCQRQMLSVGGWTIVKSCIDMDIEAEEALSEY